MRAAGVSSRKVIAPVLLFAALGHGAGGVRLAAADAAFDAREHATSTNQLEATQLSARDPAARVRRRTFPTRFCTWATWARPPVVRGSHVFIADVTPPEQRTSGMRDKAAGAADHGGARSHRGSRPEQQPHPALPARLLAPTRWARTRWPTTAAAPAGQQALDAAPPKQDVAALRAP